MNGVHLLIPVTDGVVAGEQLYRYRLLSDSEQHSNLYSFLGGSLHQSLLFTKPEQISETILHSCLYNKAVNIVIVIVILTVTPCASTVVGYTFEGVKVQNTSGSAHRSSSYVPGES